MKYSGSCIAIAATKELEYLVATLTKLLKIGLQRECFWKYGKCVQITSSFEHILHVFKLVSFLSEVKHDSLIIYFSTVCM